MLLSPSLRGSPAQSGGNISSTSIEQTLSSTPPLCQMYIETPSKFHLRKPNPSSLWKPVTASSTICHSHQATQRRTRRQTPYIAGDAGESGELVTSCHGLRFRELVQERGLANAGKSDHRHASVSAPSHIKALGLKARHVRCVVKGEAANCWSDIRGELWPEQHTLERNIRCAPF